MVFHRVDIGYFSLDQVFVPGARWKIPAIYTIVEVLDFIFAETTAIQKNGKNSICVNVLVCIRMYKKRLYVYASKNNVFEKGQLCSCTH